MNSTEWIIAFTILLTAMGMLANPILTHQKETEEKTKTIQEKNNNMECSEKLDMTLNHYTITKKENCTAYPYAIHTHTNNHSNTIGMDGNHYG